MASRAQVEQAQRALNRLSAAARGSWRAVWDELRASDRALVRRAVSEAWVEVVGAFGDMAATLAADLFEAQAADLRIRPRLDVAPGVDPVRADARLGWALSTENVTGNMAVLMDELVKQPFRSTFQDSAILSGGAWARVPSGTETCAFCLMLASRGAVYLSQESAKHRGGSGKKYHGDCDCVPTLVRGPEDYPEGYDPDDLYGAYLNARREAGSGDTSAILSELRKQQGSN